MKTLFPLAVLLALASTGAVAGASAAPNDPLLPEQPYLTQIAAPGGWEMGHADGVAIGIIDTGVMCGHQDLENCEYQLYDGFSGDHGTRVAGVAAATTNNAIGVAGLAWGARIISCRVSDDGRNIDMSLAAACVDAISSRGDYSIIVLNGSFAGPAEYQPLTEAIARARERGVPFVTGASNTNESVPGFPCASAGVLCVGSVDGADQKAGFSNWGPHVDIAAPGMDILSTTPDGYGRAYGTSLSSPMVAGAYALLYARHPDWSLDDLEEHLISTADTLNFEGVGPRLNVARAMGAPVQETPTITPTETITWTATTESTPSPTATLTTTSEPSPSGTSSSTPSLQPTEVVSSSATPTPSFPPSPTGTSSPSPTPSPTASSTPTLTATSTLTSTPTGSPWPSSTATSRPPTQRLLLPFLVQRVTIRRATPTPRPRRTSRGIAASWQ